MRAHGDRAVVCIANPPRSSGAGHAPGAEDDVLEPLRRQAQRREHMRGGEAARERTRYRSHAAYRCMQDGDGDAVVCK